MNLKNHDAVGGVPGLHLIGDLHGCTCHQFMCNREALLQASLGLVERVGLTSVGNCFHQFGDGGGVTGVVVLAESHLCLHTWPESGFVTLDVYVCNYSGDNRARAEQLFSGLCEMFNAKSKQVRRVERG